MKKWTGNIYKSLLGLAAFLPLPVFAQLNNYSFEEIDSIEKTNPKFIVVFIHTDWCKYCQTMMHTTLQNEQVIEVLNEHFLYTALDAEFKNDIVFNHHSFHYMPNGNNTGTHELATALGTINDKLSFPTICILNKHYEIIFQHASFILADDLLSILEQTLLTE